MKNILIIAIFAIWNNFALSQAALEITVIDSSNNAIGEHPVLITNELIGYSKEIPSAKNGKIQLGGLSTSGTYTISAKETELFKANAVLGIVLISEKTTSVNLVLGQKTIDIESVTVSTGPYQSINTVNGEIASELSAKEIEDLPVEGRDITRVLYRLPNITQATGFFPEAPNVSINGANSLYTNYQIDGMDNNENFLGGQRFGMPVGFTENITALTNNFSAEHGLSSNGIINVTTKSGTNQLKAEVFYITRPGPVIDAPSAFAQRDLSGNQVKDGFQRHQGGLSIGGPLIKDKTFYYFNAEHTTDLKDNLLNVPQLGINQTVRGTNHFTYLSGKIDHHWSERVRTSLRINGGIVSIGRQAGGLEGGSTFPSAANAQIRNSVNVALKNTYLGDKFTWESNYLYGHFRWDYAQPMDVNSPTVSVLDSTGAFMAYLGHPGYAFQDIEHTFVTQQKFTIYEKNHRIKVGTQFKSSGFELFGGGNANGSYTVMLNAVQQDQLYASGVGINLSPKDLPSDVQVLGYGIELRPSSFQKRQNIFSVYIEDQWTIGSKLNINYGLRYDYDNLSEGGGKGDFDNIAPRVSINYKLSKNSSIRAGYGMYYDKILYAVYSDALQFNSTSSDYQKQLQGLINLGILPQGTNIGAITNEGNLSAGSSNVNYLQGTPASQLQGERAHIFQNELRILNPNGYKNPYSHQFMLGYQHKINPTMTFYVDAMHNRSHDLFRLRNLNAPSAYPIDPNNVVVRSAADADLSRPIPIYADAGGNYAIVNNDTLRGIARNIVMTESDGRSNYYALNFTLQKDRGKDKYAFRLMYTLSYLENNTEDINFRAMDSNNFDAEWGPSINDRTHLINGIFSYYPIKNLTATVALLLQSGQPINRIPNASVYGTTDLNGDGQSFGDAYVGNSDRSPGESRNSDRLPWSATCDLSLFYKISLGNKNQYRGFIELGAQAFNIFNAQNLSGYSNNATQSNQIQVGSASSGSIIRKNAAPPRQFQFTIRYLF